jgi:hypothetical protein
VVPRFEGARRKTQDARCKHQDGRNSASASPPAIATRPCLYALEARTSHREVDGPPSNLERGGDSAVALCPCPCERRHSAPLHCVRRRRLRRLARSTLDLIEEADGQHIHTEGTALGTADSAQHGGIPPGSEGSPRERGCDWSWPCSAAHADWLPLPSHRLPAVALMSCPSLQDAEEQHPSSPAAARHHQRELSLLSEIKRALVVLPTRGGLAHQPRTG